MAKPTTPTKGASDKQAPAPTTDTASGSTPLAAAPEPSKPKEPASEPKAEAKAPEPSPPAQAPAPAAAPTTPPKSVALYRVWAHGTLVRNGTTYPPGAELELHEDVAKTIPCLEKV